MSQFLSPIVLFAIFHSFSLFDFHQNSDISNWRVVDDVVMGGRSAGGFYLNEEGHGVFEGKVSLENNGGFSSLRCVLGATDIEGHQTVCIRLKGDGKRYQFRLKAQSSDYYSYITHFTTTGEWQSIEIPLTDLYPSFRGRKLNQGNFSANSIEEMGFLIANKKAESFKLEIDKIELK